MFHAAEDFWRPPGTEVRSIADGEVSFSGRMGGYGWLVIVDHPEMNIYSLYGHLSPSRWRAEPGPVAKGDLLGYLGDEWENGGSRDEPLVAHLHLGVRAGQRTDYPGKRRMAMDGRVDQAVPVRSWLAPTIGRHRRPSRSRAAASPDRPGGFFERWWTELLLVGAVRTRPVCAGSSGAIRRGTPFWLLAIDSRLAVGIAWYLTTRGVVLIAPIYLTAAVSLLAGVVIFVRRRAENPAHVGGADSAGSGQEARRDSDRP